MREIDDLVNGMARALTIRQPWAAAICHLGKDVENRTWAPPRWMAGRTIAIHAGKVWGAQERHDLERLTLESIRLGETPLPPEWVTPSLGCIVALARLRRIVKAQGWFGDYPVRSPDRWFGGPYGWELDNIIVLDQQYPCKGALGLFGLTYDLAAAIAEDPALRRLEASDDEYDDTRDEEYENSPRGLAGFGKDEWI